MKNENNKNKKTNKCVLCLELRKSVDGDAHYFWGFSLLLFFETVVRYRQGNWNGNKKLKCRHLSIRFRPFFLSFMIGQLISRLCVGKLLSRFITRSLSLALATTTTEAFSHLWQGQFGLCDWEIGRSNESMNLPVNWSIHPSLWKWNGSRSICSMKWKDSFCFFNFNFDFSSVSLQEGEEEGEGGCGRRDWWV